MKKLVALMLAVCMMSGCSAALAASWYCPECGVGNNGSFCTECGEAKPASGCPSCGEKLPANHTYKFCPSCGESLGGVKKSSSAKMKFTSVYENDDGTVTVSWSDSESNGPYKVAYMPMAEEEFPDALAAGKPLLVDDDCRNVRGTTATLAYLVPDHAYWITVQDSEGNLLYTPYYPTFDSFTTFRTSIVLELKRHTGVTTYKPAAFNAKEIKSDLGETSYGTYVALSHGVLSSDRYYRVVFAVECPGGYVQVVHTDPLTVPKKSRDHSWGFVSLDGLFSNLIAIYDSVPAGTYKFHVYFDGQHAVTGSFRVDH